MGFKEDWKEDVQKFRSDGGGWVNLVIVICLVVFTIAVAV